MEPRITGREVMMFIAKFRLWDATLDTDLDGDCIDFRTTGYGCNECSYELFPNGLYTIDVWVEGEREEDHWERIETGDIFELDNVIRKEESK